MAAFGSEWGVREGVVGFVANLASMVAFAGLTMLYPPFRHWVESLGRKFRRIGTSHDQHYDEK